MENRTPQNEKNVNQKTPLPNDKKNIDQGADRASPNKDRQDRTQR